MRLRKVENRKRKTPENAKTTKYFHRTQTRGCNEGGSHGSMRNHAETPIRPSIPSHGIIEKEICKVVFVGWWIEVVLSSNSDDGKAAAVHMLFAI
jgi:hypothetical protein